MTSPLVRRTSRRIAGILLVGAMTAVPTPAGSALAANPVRQDITWGAVQTVRSGSSATKSLITTDNGMTVAVWSGLYFENLSIAVRRIGHGWSKPTKVVTTTVSAELVKDGRQAWLIWQGSDVVRVLRISADGSISPPEVLGSSAGSSQAGLAIASGSGGATVAVWNQGTPLVLTYQAPGGHWTAPEVIPETGLLKGLVVGADGRARLVVFAQQGLVSLQRSANGAWSKPLLLSTDAAWARVAGNQHGDLVVGWGVNNADGTFSLLARYKPAESGFGPEVTLIDNAPDGSNLVLAMAGDGATASVYRLEANGKPQVTLTPTDSSGHWLESQPLALAASYFRIAMNDAGSFVVTTLEDSLHLVSCSADNVCSQAQRNDATGGHEPLTALGPQGAITLLWSRGCHSESCFPTSIKAQRGR